MIFTLCRQILSEMLQYKMRSLLALFGIFWGTMTVVLLLALGAGFHHASKANIMRLVDGTYFVLPAQRTMSWRGYAKGTPINVKSSFILTVKKNVPNIRSAVPVLQNKSSISAIGHRSRKNVIGSTRDFAWIRQIVLIPKSRFIDPLDIKNSRRVVVLGYRLKKRLFKEKSALGKTILISTADKTRQNVSFRVVGVIQQPKDNIYNDCDRSAIIPYTTYIDLWGDQNIAYFSVLPNSSANPETVKNNLIRYFSYRYHFNPKDKKVLQIFDTTKMFQYFLWFFIGIRVFLALCGAMTLGVGSLGVANIMFLIVTERTKEIGVRMSVGATERAILFQVLLESLIIIFIGGCLGILASWGIVEILHYVTLPAFLGKPSISWLAVGITVIILTVLGLLAGYFPAKRASRMDPVTALGFR